MSWEFSYVKGFGKHSRRSPPLCSMPSAVCLWYWIQWLFVPYHMWSDWWLTRRYSRLSAQIKTYFKYFVALPKISDCSLPYISAIVFSRLLSLFYLNTVEPLRLWDFTYWVYLPDLSNQDSILIPLSSRIWSISVIDWTWYFLAQIFFKAMSTEVLSCPFFLILSMAGIA